MRWEAGSLARSSSLRTRGIVAWGIEGSKEGGRRS
jgi:hypothetical protein